MTSKFIIANFKMNGSFESIHDWNQSFIDAAAQNLSIFENVNAVICPPSIFLDEASANIMEFAIDKADEEISAKNDIDDEVAGELIDKYRTLFVGAQDCSKNIDGAFTGDISSKMLSNAGAEFVIVGHSERRKYQYETNKDVAQKVSAAVESELVPVLCIGESQEVRDSDKHVDFVAKQLLSSVPEDVDIERLIIAYEPIWAIGTGLVPTVEQIAQMTAKINEVCGENLSNVKNFHILYGGSVSIKNSKEILAVKNVDGLLIGKTSLNADDFFAICEDAAVVI